MLAAICVATEDNDLLPLFGVQYLVKRNGNNDQGSGTAVHQHRVSSSVST